MIDRARPFEWKLYAFFVMKESGGGIPFDRVERMYWHELIELWGAARIMAGIKPETE